MNAKRAKLDMDTKQEKVSMNITSLPRVVLEKIVSHLFIGDRTSLRRTNKFFSEFVPTVLMNLDSVEIFCLGKMDAKRAKLELDTKQKEKVSRDISTLPTLVLENIISNLDIIERTRLSTTSKFFYEFVSTIKLKLDSVDIYCHTNIVVVSVPVPNGASCHSSSRSFSLKSERNLDFYIKSRKGPATRRLEKARHYLEKLLNNKMVEVDKLMIQNLRQKRKSDILRKLLSIFPSEINCRKVHMTDWTPAAAKDLLEKMKTNMEEIRSDNRICNQMYIWGMEQLRTADRVHLSLHFPSPNFFNKCRILNKVHIDIYRFGSEHHRRAVVSAFRDGIKSSLNGHCQQLREMKISIRHEDLVECEEMISGIPNIRMTSSRCEKEQSPRIDGDSNKDNLESRPSVLLHHFKSFRVERLSANSTVMRRVNIDWHDSQLIKFDRMPVDVEALLRQDNQMVDGIHKDWHNVDITVYFEDHEKSFFDTNS